ncbi:uncharacterized protein LOC129803568 [Phlebotomus papatasi]|uniref:uncharacterized protein LOC129803568 n=1 Tax=Phlebotomus papatasi TaxID=29031 RepID=UPI002483D04B|nr:uncharacterized protein LOC129803568 [Phlebotomus papatasi]
MDSALKQLGVLKCWREMTESRQDWRRLVAIHASHVLMFHVPASHRPYGEVFSVFQAARQTVSHKEIPQNGKQHGPHATRTDKCTILGETPHCSGIRINVTNNVKRSSWWGTPGVKEAVSEKKKAYKLYIQRKDSESRDRYVEARKAAKLAVKAAREEAWKKFGEKLELDYRMANKTFWQTVRRLRGKKSNSIQGVTSKDGNLLTKEEEVLSRWKEYFSELLNPQQGTDGDVPMSKGREESSPSESEVLYAISKLKDGKAAGIDEIRPEMLKLMGIAGANWLTRVIKVAWQSGRAPKDWQIQFTMGYHAVLLLEACPAAIFGEIKTSFPELKCLQQVCKVASERDT